MAADESVWASLKALKQRLDDDARLATEARAQADAKRAEKQRDQRLFLDYVKDVTPLPDRNRIVPGIVEIEPQARQRQLDEARALEESISDEFDAESLLETDDLLSWRREGIGADVVRRLRRGAWVIQDQVDLHGSRRDEARLLVGEFLRDSVKRGLRCVRIVHGKGLGSIDRQPVLKGRVRRWLTQKDEVLAFCQARAQDGGSGAMVVLLRPSR
jgi:DNA-nicking Smr family endonuclease